MKNRFRTVVLTGANRGLGLAFAEHYLSQGARVVAGVRQPNAADTSTLRHLPQNLGRGTLEVWPLDVAQPASIEAFAKRARQEIEAVDLLLNNAGVAHWDELDEVTPENMLQCFSVNAMGPLFLTRGLIPILAKGRDPLVVNISTSMGSITRRASYGSEYPYGTSKAALNMITVQLAKDLRPRGIAVVAQHPGWVRTDMGGADATLSITESTALTTKLIAGYGAAHSGHYYAHTGEELPW